MSARDRFYPVVKTALVKDGWRITHDPFRLSWGAKDLYADLGAERLLAADKGAQRIAVEIKSFLGPSLVTDFHAALGQFLNTESSWTARIPNVSSTWRSRERPTPRFLHSFSHRPRSSAMRFI